MDWDGRSRNSCLAQFGCKSLIPQECPGLALGTSCPAQGAGAAGGAALPGWDTGRDVLRVWDGHGAAGTAPTARLPLPISSALSAGFLGGFFPLIARFKHHLDLK